jgi:hypothetical protein
MESSRESSIWRSLAVAFGDGLAFGVGMKLSQKTVQHAGHPATADFTPVTTRLAQLEDRLERMEHAPALPSAGGAGIDQKVLEAVVNALEARLREHAVQVERRLTDLDAKLAIELQSLHQEDRSIASGAQACVDETREQFSRRLVEARERLENDIGSLRGQVVSLNREFAEAVARIVEQQVAASVKGHADALGQKMGETLDQKFAQAAQSGEERVSNALESQAGALERQVAALVEARLGAIEQQVSSAMEARLGTVEQQVSAAVEAQLGAIEQQVSAAVSAHLDTSERQVAATVDARIDGVEARITAALRGEFDALDAELRAQMGRQERQIAELRERLAESDRAALDFVLAVADLCRKTAERSAKPAAPAEGFTGRTPEPAPGEANPATPPAEPPAPPASFAAPAEPPSGVLAAAAPEASPPAFLDPPVPGFAQPKPGRSWRFPVVSSFLAVTATILALRCL